MSFLTEYLEEWGFKYYNLENYIQICVYIKT